MSSIIFTVTNDISYDRRMHRICTSLASHGFEVMIIGRKLSYSVPIPHVNYGTKRVSCFFNRGKLFYLEYNIRLFFILLLTRAEIYAAVDLDTIIPCFTVAILQGKRKAYDAHEYFSEVPEVVHRPLVRSIWEWVGNIFVPMADVATTVSKSLAEIFTKKYKVPFVAIMNVPYMAEEISLERGQYLLYQGALNKGRGLEQLIEGMQVIDMPLKIAGEGDLSEALRHKVNKLGLQNKIEFLGFVLPENLGALTSGAYIGLNLLENDGLSYYTRRRTTCVLTSGGSLILQCLRTSAPAAITPISRLLPPTMSSWNRFRPCPSLSARPVLMSLPAISTAS